MAYSIDYSHKKRANITSFSRLSFSRDPGKHIRARGLVSGAAVVAAEPLLGVVGAVAPLGGGPREVAHPAGEACWGVEACSEAVLWAA